MHIFFWLIFAELIMIIFINRMSSLFSDFKKLMKRGWFCMLGGLVLSLYSCSKEYEAVSNNGNAEKGVYFSSSIAGGYNTKAQGTQWSQNDSIGIFMFKTEVH